MLAKVGCGVIVSPVAKRGVASITLLESDGTLTSVLGCVVGVAVGVGVRVRVGVSVGVGVLVLGMLAVAVIGP